MAGAWKKKRDKRIIAALQHIADGRGSLVDFANDHGLSYGVLKKQLNKKYDEAGAEGLHHLLAMYFRQGLIS